MIILLPIFHSFNIQTTEKTEEYKIFSGLVNHSHITNSISYFHLEEFSPTVSLCISSFYLRPTFLSPHFCFLRLVFLNELRQVYNMKHLIDLMLTKIEIFATSNGFAVWHTVCATFPWHMFPPCFLRHS